MATYRIDPAMHELLGAKLIHLIFRNGNVIGRYGRRGCVSGVLQGHALTATLRDSKRAGTLTVTFAQNFESFQGLYVTEAGAEPAQHACSGERLRR